ncbi:MAG: hypothetical protein J6F30_06215 [Cellulosilyticum sp.]|nr:hypothetical protein [Cellulosilyticum sp.]
MRTFACDFETTVYEGQTSTEVWSSALVELNTERVIVHHSIEHTFYWLNQLRQDVTLYYHNLKFDGSFWLDFLLKIPTFQQAIDWIDEEHTHGSWLTDKEMPKGSYKYMISNMGQWYTITIRLMNGKYITIRDSYKLMPFALKDIGKSFKTKHQKLEMEYTGYRYAGCDISDEELKYIENDVLVLKEALEFMFKEGHNKLTIGSCCLSEFKNIKESPWSARDNGVEASYDWFFPNLEEIGLDEVKYGAPNVDRYIRNSYNGGWCYVVKGKENQIKRDGVTADVNSLYPSVMHSESGSIYPIGKPTFWSGDYIPDEAKAQHRFYFVRFRCRFYIKDGKLPFVHIRNKLIYNSNENLTTSDFYDGKTGKYSTHYLDHRGVKHSTEVILTMTQTDFELFLDHYNVVDFKILDGCYFMADIGLFDPYIDKWKKVKMTSKGAMRTLAKLFLNNLYGKMASSTDSSFKVAFMDEKGVKFKTIEAHDKPIGYIPIGSAITSYARNFTIRTAQKNYYGVNERGFIYADTDSIHCDLQVDELVDVPIHESDFCHWKIENSWDKAIFVRQKTYIEHTIAEDMEPVENPYYLVKCAGMPKHCKDLFVYSMEQNITDKEYNKLTDEGKVFVKEKRTIEDFCLGLTVPEKLMPKRIDGGVLLVSTTYKMR